MKNPKKILMDKAVNENIEAFPGLPIVEIAGDSRVLIENHLCILEYHVDQIVVKMKYGLLYIKGSKLSIVQMSAQQLVICGCIESLALQRGM